QRLELVLDVVRVKVVINTALGQRARGILQHRSGIVQAFSADASFSQRLDDRLLGFGGFTRGLFLSSFLIFQLLLELVLLLLNLRLLGCVVRRLLVFLLEQVTLFDSSLLPLRPSLGTAANHEQSDTHGNQNLLHLFTPLAISDKRSPRR